MGLDYSIELHIRDKKTGSKREIELAYWRKTYGLRDTMMEIASHDYIRAEDDYAIECPTRILGDVIRKFWEIFPNRHAREWEDSIWGASRTRAMTFRQFEKLATVDSLYNDKEADLEDVCEDASSLLGEDYDLFLDTIMNPDNYVVTIVFFNSY